MNDFFVNGGSLKLSCYLDSFFIRFSFFFLAEVIAVHFFFHSATLLLKFSHTFRVAEAFGFFGFEGSLCAIFYVL